jgi:hypothetical protein
MDWFPSGSTFATSTSNIVNLWFRQSPREAVKASLPMKFAWKVKVVMLVQQVKKSSTQCDFKNLT